MYIKSNLEDRIVKILRPVLGLLCLHIGFQLENQGAVNVFVFCAYYRLFIEVVLIGWETKRLEIAKRGAHPIPEMLRITVYVVYVFTLVWNGYIAGGVVVLVSALLYEVRQDEIKGLLKTRGAAR